MKKYFITLGITLVLIITGLIGCIEEEKGNIVIKGKGNFNAIQSAIDNSSDGDSIIIYEGTYYETEISIIKIIRDNCSIDGFMIIGNSSSTQLTGIEIMSSNDNITNNTIQNTYYGISQQNSNNNTISKNMIYNTNTGLSMRYSNNNKIISNNFSNNYEYGIYTQYQSNNNIFNLNIISENVNGIRIKSSRYNIIENNIIYNSKQRGIYLCCGATNNTVFKNSLINNWLSADDHYDNQWYFDNVGNYWDDYNDKYPGVIDENNDGFWDTPYIIHEENMDLYPLVHQMMGI